MLLDRILSAFAMAQAILVTLRAGSKVLTGLWSSQHDDVVAQLLDLPLILPPPLPTSKQGAGNETQQQLALAQQLLLFDLTVAFRQGVKLGLQLDEYATTNPDYSKLVAIETISKVANVAAAEPYRMSLVPYVRAADMAAATAIVGVETREDPLDGDDNKDRIITGEPKEDHTVIANANNNKDAPKSSGKPAFINVSLRNKRKRSSRQQQRNKKEEKLLLSSSSDDGSFDESWVSEYTLVASSQSARIRAYAPRSFATLRGSFGMSDDAFRQALLESGPYCSFQSNSKGAARTGGVFFLTRDGSYLIKTIKRDELRTLLHMLPMYTHFMKENGRRSLLNRFCGLYEVSLNDGRERHYFVVMNSVFPGGARISERFDLKGSTVGRKASVEEREMLGSRAVLKDLDLAHENVSAERAVVVVDAAAVVDDELLVEQADRDTDGGKVPDSHHGHGYLHIGPTAKAALLAQLRMDVELLRNCSVIDYSLLVGVSVDPDDSLVNRKKGALAEKVGDFASMALRATLGMPSKRQQCGAGPLAMLPGEHKGRPATYYFGLIDFLQPFDYKKDLEYRLKGLVYKKASYSCVPPALYAQRFLDFVDKHVN